MTSDRVSDDAIARLQAVRKALHRAEAFANEYEFDSDEGCHTPSDLERMLMLDMLNGLFDDDPFVAILTELQHLRFPHPRRG